uniref:Putative chloroplast protein CP12 n=1 Tax=Solanum tuberosum TaxID=4113 RepID=K7W5M1_SOLTU|nr:putative chloroplast protein CP12 [Solanum tuberosum]
MLNCDGAELEAGINIPNPCCCNWVHEERSAKGVDEWIRISRSTKVGDADERETADGNDREESEGSGGVRRRQVGRVQGGMGGGRSKPGGPSAYQASAQSRSPTLLSRPRRRVPHLALNLKQASIFP